MKKVTGEISLADLRAKAYAAHEAHEADKQAAKAAKKAAKAAQPKAAKLATFGELLASLPNMRGMHFDKAVLSMPPDTECGAACAAVLVAANALVQLCEEPEAKRLARKAASHQINVFYFG